MDIYIWYFCDIGGSDNEHLLGEKNMAKRTQLVTMVLLWLDVSSGCSKLRGELNIPRSY